MYLSHELIFSILAFLIVLWSSIVYWIGIFRGTIIPHPFTYGIWVVVLSISATELIREDEWKGALAIILLTLSSLLALLWGVAHWRKLQINWMDWLFLFA